MLVLHYLSILIVSYGILYLVGKIFFSFFISSSGPASEIFLKLFFGICSVTTAYALLATEGNSVLLPLLFFLIILTFYKTYFSTQPIFLISNGVQSSIKIKFFEPLVILCFIFFVQLYSIYDFESPSFFLPSNPDRLLFADITEFMNYASVESSKINYFNFGEYNASPYHYFELWFTGLLSFSTKLNTVFLDHLVAAPIFGTIIYMGARAISEYFGIQFLYSSVIAFILSVLNFQIQFPFLEYFEILQSTEVYFQLSAIEYAKFFPIYIFLISSIIFFLNKEFTLSFLTFSILPIVNILLLPPYLLCIALLIPFASYKKHISRVQLLNIILILLSILVFIVLFYFVLNANPKESSELNFLELGDEMVINALSRTSLNIIIGSIVQVIYVMLPVILILSLFFKKYFYYFQSNQIILHILFILILFSLVGLLIWALFRLHPESHQFYIRHAHIIINLLFVFTFLILYNFSQAKAWVLISVILVLKTSYLYSDMKTYRSLSKFAYSAEFTKEIGSELDINDANGVFIRDRQSLLSARSKSSNFRIGYFTHLLNNNFYLVNISDFTNTKSEGAIIKIIEQGMLNEHPFQIFIKNQKLDGTFKSIADSQYEFIKKNKISFLILEKGATLPSDIIPLVQNSLSDRYSGETIFFFSQYN